MEHISMTMERIESFDEFWPHYLREHSDPRSRWLHFVGTSGFLAATAASVVSHPVRFPAAMLGFAAVFRDGFEKEKRSAPLKHVAAMVALGSAGAPRTFPAGVVFAYACAWMGHFGIEKNRPATFEYPLWSLTADFKMWSHMIRGRLWFGDPLEQLDFDADHQADRTAREGSIGDGAHNDSDHLQIYGPEFVHTPARAARLKNWLWSDSFFNGLLDRARTKTRFRDRSFEGRAQSARTYRAAPLRDL